MSIFSRQDPEPVVTGTEILRQTLAARGRTPHMLSLIANEIGSVGVNTLENFAAGKVDLAVSIKHALAKHFYQNAEFDPELDLLRSTAPPATLMGIRPAPYKRTTPNVVPRYTIGPQPVNPEKPRVKTSRPGWLGGWT